MAAFTSSVAMQDAHSALPFEAEDLQPLPIEDVTLRLRVSHAFTQVCLDCGCPLRANRISAAELLHWLFENYERVRSLAGLKPRDPVGELASAPRARIRMANAIFTLLEFGNSRATNPRQKRDLRAALCELKMKLEGH